MIKAHLNKLTKDELIELLLQTRAERNIYETLYERAFKHCESLDCIRDCKTCHVRCRAWQNGYNAKYEREKKK